MKRRLGLVGLLLVLVALAITIWLPAPRNTEAIPGRPLLGTGDFDDEYSGVKFTPPPGWAMQVRSAESSLHRPERMLVKYKRFTEPAGWLRLRMADSDLPLAEFLAGRSPPESGFVRDGDIRPAELAGQPAARITYRGEFNPEGRGAKPYRCEVFAVKHRGRVLEFAATLPVEDTSTLEPLLSSISLR